MASRSWSLVWSVLVVLGSLAGAPGMTPAAQAPKRPNVLFLVADDLNCDLACYGHPQVKTPNIDRLASRGVLFERAYCQFPLCSPSRSSFLTGRRPDVTRIVTNPGAARFATQYTGTPHFREFLPDTITLPQLFRQNGYSAQRVGKLYHYGVPGQIGTSGLDDTASWNNVVNPAGRDKAEENKIFTLVPNSFGGTLSWLAADGADIEQTDGLIATAAISLLEEAKSQASSFFLAVGFFRPHTPYVSPKKYFNLYPLDQIDLPSLSADDKSRVPAAAYASAKKEQDSITDQRRREAIQAYWASISFMDAQVGRVLDALDQLGLAETTIVTMISDHGYHLADHGLWQKMSLFERSSRVPLIVAVPAAKGNGGKTKALAELVDLYPTLAHAAGLKPPDYLDGKNLRPVLDDPSSSVREAAFTQVRRGQFDGYAIRTARYRFVSYGDGKQGEQLFDMENDPAESKNLAADPQHAELVKSFRERLHAYTANRPRS